MREKPTLWTGAERIQWGCVLMRLLGEVSLEHLHVVLAGFRSVERSRQVAPFAQSVYTARVLLGDLVTKQAVQHAVYDFLDGAEHRSFDINPQTLRFNACYDDGLDPAITEATTILQRGLARSTSERRLADSQRDLVAQIGPDTSVKLRLHGLRFPEIRQHSRTRQPKEAIRVKLSDLRELAAQLDAEDRAAGRPSQAWAERISHIDLQHTTGRGLRKAEVLDLSDLKHLIGLPGSGKTTLITLLCVLLARRCPPLRVAVFFTSIEVARQYLETLWRYGVRAAILMGRSGQTHRRHANDIAELIAGQGDGGFGHTREGVELFATGCPLPAFAETWPGEEEWPMGEAPCEDLREVGSEGKRLCPAWELCGRVMNQRELVDADVWLGHVLSSDTTVPAHTSSERLRYFELIAEGFDLVIFDECDATQRELDEYGSLPQQFLGDEQSLHANLQRMTGLLAANRTRISDGMLSHVLRANEFERHTLRFLAAIRRLSQHPQQQRLAREYADTLLTGNFLLREALRAAGTYELFTSRALSAVSDFWERAMYQAFFFRAAEVQCWPKAEQYAADLGFNVEEANQRWRRLTRALKDYLMLDHASAADEVIELIATELAVVFRTPNKVDDVIEHVRLLIAVGFTVASYQHLAKSARPLVQRGEIPGEEQSAFFARASRELREHVPRSLLGTFSGVRYRRAPEGSGYEIDYVVMDLTPRLLLHRLHELGRANVLLASATSWLPPSSAYHVERRPTYVLAPRQEEAGDVRLYVQALPDPRTGKPLRFSGAGLERDQNLRAMVTALARPDADNLSELDRAVRAVTTRLGRRRKAALVVNSYEQVRLVVDQVHDVHPVLGKRTRGVLRELPTGATRARYVLKGQVEALGSDDDVDVVVFPIAALGRGINIVFRTNDADDGRGAVGSIYFLTRPHPAAGDLGLMISLLARETLAFDRADLQHLSLAEVRHVYDVKRYQLYRRVANLLARPMSASRLDPETLTTFAANLLVPILQTIGRGMRKGMPVRVYFVDAAWAPESAEGRPETDRSSLLVIMRDILNRCLDDPDPDLRDIYQALYGVFRDAFDDIVGLSRPQAALADPVNLFDPAPLTSELDFDGYNPANDLPDVGDLSTATAAADGTNGDNEETGLGFIAAAVASSVVAEETDADVD